MHDTAAPWAEASSLLASSFYDFLNEDGMTFEEFESRSIAYGHAAIADAISAALERKDKSLCADLPDGCRVHDKRPKTLASEVGDLSFSYRRVRDAHCAACACSPATRPPAWWAVSAALCFQPISNCMAFKLPLFA